MSEYQPANLMFWDSVDEFTIYEVAWLWCGLEPPEYLKVYRVPLGLSSERIQHIHPPNPPSMGARIRGAILKERHAQDGISPLGRNDLGHYSRYSRADLRAWAERQGYRPPFLFPELRLENQAELSLKGALQIITVLATAVDPRWKPGSHAPRGMVKRLTEVAGSLGLQLDRNTIGKYLKEAGNKNISA